MIEVTFQSGTFVWLPGQTNESLFGPGSFALPGVDSLQVGTNEVWDLSAVVSGSRVAVDAVGQCAVSLPADVTGSAMAGFVAGIVAVGFLVFLRWFARTWLPKNEWVDKL